MKKYIFLLWATGLLLTACSDKKNNPAEPTTEAPAANATGSETVQLTEQQFKNIGVTVGQPEKQLLGTTLQLSGEVDVPPAGMVHVSVPYGGFLRQTSLIPGAKVRKGQVLAVLEHPDYVQLQQDYLDTKTKIEMALLEYNRQKELTEEKVGARKNFEQVRMELQLLRNSEAALKQKLRMVNINAATLTPGRISRTINITSPINGFVEKVNANLGQMVNATDILVELVNPDDLHIKLNIYEKDIAKLNRGQKFSFKLPNDPKEYTAEIALIGRSVEGDKIIPVHGHILNPDPTLLPGMFVTATIQTGEAEATVVPEAAVVLFEGKSFVYAATGNLQFKRTEVETGTKSQGKVEVKLPAGITQIAIAGAHNLLAIQANVEEE